MADIIAPTLTSTDHRYAYGLRLTSPLSTYEVTTPYLLYSIDFTSNITCFDNTRKLPNSLTTSVNPPQAGYMSLEERGGFNSKETRIKS
jgi:hypothetical protein